MSEAKEKKTGNERQTSADSFSPTVGADGLSFYFPVFIFPGGSLFPFPPTQIKEVGMGKEMSARKMNSFPKKYSAWPSGCQKITRL